MKLAMIILSTISLLGFFNSSEIYPSCNTKISVHSDSIPKVQFYGLTAHKITTMEIEEIRYFCTTHDILLSQFVLTRTKAKNYLLKQQAKCDSIEVVKIYERIDKRLDIDK